MNRKNQHHKIGHIYAGSYSRHYISISDSDRLSGVIESNFNAVIWESSRRVLYTYLQLS